MKYKPLCNFFVGIYNAFVACCNFCVVSYNFSVAIYNFDVVFYNFFVVCPIFKPVLFGYSNYYNFFVANSHLIASCIGWNSGKATILL